MEPIKEGPGLYSFTMSLEMEAERAVAVPFLFFLLHIRQCEVSRYQILRRQTLQNFDVYAVVIGDAE
jgi:hypothetical protein